MPQFPWTIHNQGYDFLPKSYFLVYEIGDAVGVNLGRTTFTTMTELEKEREVREHRESGSKIPWHGGNVETPQPITFTRGLAVRNADFDNGIEAWYETGVKKDLYVDVFNDNAEDDPAAAPQLRYSLVRAKPQKYKAFGGDSKSGDTCLEELTVVVSRWHRVSGGGAAGNTVTLTGLP